RHHLRGADQERLGAFPTRRQTAGLSQSKRRQRVGRTHERSAAKGLLRERAPRRDGGGFARLMRDLFRNDWRSGLLLAGCWRHVEADRPGSAGGFVRRSANAEMIRVVLPHHLRTLARVNDEVQLGLNGSATIRSVLEA